MKTTTSLIDPLLASVEETAVETPCECPGGTEAVKQLCPYHIGACCKAAARWMVRCRHAADFDADVCVTVVAAVCGDCLEMLKAWAVVAIDKMARFTDSACPFCGGRCVVVADLVADVVPL